MFKNIKSNLLFCILLGFYSCSDNFNKGKSDTDVLFFDSKTKSKGLLIDGKKEGVWEYLHENTEIEYKCVSDNSLTNKSIFFVNISGIYYPLGAKLNHKKEGLWLNYDENGLIKNYGVFHLNDKYDSSNVEIKTLFNGKEGVIGSKISNKKVGLWLTYNDTSLLFASTFDNDTMNGVFITSPMGKYKKNSCSCAKNGFLDGYSFELYSHNKLSYWGKFYNRKKIGVWEYYDTLGSIIQKIDYSGQSPKIIFGKDSNLILPPPPPPPSNNKNTK